ncbi:hypothetical protein LOD99_4936 [Oopsacas minuta]|uniref:Uncharacterized protein n=1 Tax=Oopsacas minuta TaxID=111878 RepID=A0AAV7JRR6_9METZ|nr:hypothetical protein LOD99_4936 [Oopsacas minuta]
MSRLQVQLHQHIQILFQTYLLSINDPQLQDINSYTCRLIQDFYSNISTETQLFPIPGLDEAMQLVYSPPKIEWKHRKTKLIPNSVIRIMHDYNIFWTFPKLLPHQILMPLKRSDDEQKGRKFVLAEDCMLAFGLSVFGLVDGLMKICKYVLPTKTPKQIISRIRNLCSSRYDTNVVKHWKQTNELKIPWKELEESHTNTIPLWAKQCLDEYKNTVKTQPRKRSRIKKKDVSNCQAIELSPSFVNTMLLECDSIGKNLSQCHRLAIMNIIFDIDKYQTSAIDRNTFYRRLASGLWCFVTTALRKDEHTYYKLIDRIEENSDGNINRLVEQLTTVLKYHPALLFLFLKFLKTPTQQKEDQTRAFLKAKTFIDKVREKFKSNPEKALLVFKTINNLSKDKLPNQELQKVIRESLANLEGSDEIFNECITENCELSSVSDGEYEEIYFIENSAEQDEDKYEFEEIYLEPPICSTTQNIGSSSKKRKITKTSNKKKIVIKKPKKCKSNKKQNKCNPNKKQKLTMSDS